MHPHDHLLFVDTGAAARRIEQLPWIESATVHRDLPGTLKITVKEYIPTAYVRVAGGVMLLAANGHAIARVARVPAHTIEVRGVRRAPDAGELLAPPDAASVVGQLPAALAQRVAAVDVSGDGIALDTIGNGEIRLGDTTDLAAKAASALAVVGKPRHRALRVPRRVGPEPSDRRACGDDGPVDRCGLRRPMIDSTTTLRYSLDAKHRLT